MRIQKIIEIKNKNKKETKKQSIEKTANQRHKTKGVQTRKARQTNANQRCRQTDEGRLLSILNSTENENICWLYNTDAENNLI